MRAVYCLPGDFIREGIRFLYHNDKLNEEDKRKATAWLFGYTSHVVMDLTVHPVVERKVGTYDDNEWKHKRCESQQDAYIFPKNTKIEITEANYLRGAGLRSCIDEDTGELHGLTAAIWTHCAKFIKKKSKATKYSRPRPLRNPNPQDWFGWFCTLLDRVVEEGHHIPIISRGTQALGVTCPRKEDIDMTFVENLELPDGTKGHFEDVFERGRSNVMRYWGELSDALISKNAEKFTLPNGNLDTGRVDELNAELIDMGVLIERAIGNSVQALVKQNRELCHHVIVSDKEINRRTAAIESKALRILLMQQPVASDLRVISTALKVVTDMERIGDQARDVCGIVLSLCDENYEPTLNILPAMGELAKEMVHAAVDSFVKIDTQIAERIIKIDDDMDNMFAKLRQKMIKLINEKPEFADQALYFMMIGKYFEKIGDHAENIADWVIFEKSGEHKRNKLL